MDRRQFLKLSGAGVAGAMLLTTVSAGSVLAQPTSDLQQEFEEAAEKYRVPVEVLLAMGYVNTRWEMPPPETSEYEKGDLHGFGAYGMMRLVQNPFEDTLGEASRLTGIAEEKLKTDRRANILGGAALLAASQGAKNPEQLGGYFGALAGRGDGRGKRFKALAGIGAGRPFAVETLDVLKKGASGETKRGERVRLRSQDLAARLTQQGKVMR